VAGWKDVADRIAEQGTVQDIVRRENLRALFDHTGRNVIAYYSSWLQKQGLQIPGEQFIITDADKSGFMAATHGMDKAKGLDLILHTPGGDVGATESLGDYLRGLFDANIRVIVPQLAMSGGTMLACLGNEILMGKHSSLGPIGPQFGGIDAQEIVDEFNKACAEAAANPATIPIWQVIIQKYPPAFVGTCAHAIEWSKEIAQRWLATGMVDRRKARKIALKLRNIPSHTHHISGPEAQKLGLNVTALEDDNKLQDLVLTVHHCYIQSLAASNVTKITENHDGLAVVSDFTLLRR